MILAHVLVGITAGTYVGDMPYILAGSIFPDMDHLIVIVKNKTYSWDKLLQSLRTDGKHGLKYKTKYVHSIFGAVIFSAPLLLISSIGAWHFFLSYLGHLALDWVDHDEKQYLFPLKKKFRGFLPIFSRVEIAFTIGLVALMIEIIKKTT